MSRREAAIALTRFGMGAMPGEIERVSKDPRGWLHAQIENPDGALSETKKLLTTDSAAQFVIEGQVRIKTAKNDFKDGKIEEETLNETRREVRVLYKQVFQTEIYIRNKRALTTLDGFTERWVRFWSNHFSVSASEPNLLPIVNPFEREAIRPHVYGNFSDLLKATTFHPAMLVYLNNNVSIGPNSKAAKWNRPDREKPPGLNENLAREVLELHSLGVDGGYEQSDVTAFAKMLTGWTVLGWPSFLHQSPANIGEVIFYSNKHEHQAQSFLGRTYSAVGKKQAGEALRDIANHPASARHLSRKLVRHFADDVFDESDAKILEDVFRQSKGDLKEVAYALIGLGSLWKNERRKFKTPEELIVSTGRAMGPETINENNFMKFFRSLSQVPFDSGTPQGWSDSAADWSGPDAIKKRIEWAYQMAEENSKEIDGLEFLERSLGEDVSDKTREAVKLAENNRMGLTLAIMSPEFQRR